MGNWRTVRIVGTCGPEDVARLRAVVGAYNRTKGRAFDAVNWDSITCLSYGGGIFGLGDWPGERIDAMGNLFERNYSIEDVAEALRSYVPIAPSLAVKVHCGGDWEDNACVATVTLAGGEVTIGPPEIADVGDFTAADTEERIIAALANARVLPG